MKSDKSKKSSEYLKKLELKRECMDCKKHVDRGGPCGGRQNRVRGNPCILRKVY